MDRGTLKQVFAVLGVIGGVLLAIFFGGDGVKEVIAMIGAGMVAAGFFGCLL